MLFVMGDEDPVDGIPVQEAFGIQRHALTTWMFILVNLAFAQGPIQYVDGIWSNSDYQTRVLRMRDPFAFSRI